MLETLDCLRTRSEIKKIRRLDNGLIAICTSVHGVRIFSPLEDTPAHTVTHENLNGLTTAVGFSPNGEFMAFSNNNYIFVLHIQSKVVLKNIKTDGEHIQNLEFDPESKYIIASTQSGRILQYRYDGSSLIARLYSFRPKDTKKIPSANAFAFHNKTMACAANNGEIFFINLHSRANKISFSNTSATINSIFFLDSDTLITGDEKGTIYFNSLKDQTLIKKMDTCFTTVRQILLLPKQKYMMVIGNDKFAAVYDIENYKLLHSKYIEFDDTVKKIDIIDNKNLIATLQNNVVVIVKLPNSNELKSLILHNSLDKAYNLVKRNPLLKDTSAYQKLELSYNKIYNEALEYLIHENKEKALSLTAMFKYVDEKKEGLQELFKAFENYTRFKTLYVEKKYALAYTMANKFPPLMRTFQYAKIEEHWMDTFKNAQRQIAHSKHENAVTLLSQYATVAQKRPIIKLILKDNDDFLKFLRAIELKEFQIIEKYAKQNSLFKEVPTYQSVQSDMEKELDSIQKEIIACNLSNAVKKLSKLQNIESISQRVALQKQECIAIKKLQDAYDKNNFLKCFEIIDTYNSLNTTKLGILLQNHWTKTMIKCESFALKGNVKSIKETLGDLLHLPTRRDKIGDLFRLAFHIRIKAMMANKANKKAEAIIYSYIDIFGLDKELISIMKLYEKRTKSKLAITHNARQSRDNWIHSKAIMGD